MKKRTFVLLALCCIFAATLKAAFIVEPHSSGRGYSNFTGTSPSYTAQALTSAAPGLTGTMSAYGGNAVLPNKDTYIFSYTPGTNADNWVVPTYQYFGNGLYSTNLAGGQTGYYNVYITWPSSTNVDAAGCNLYVTHNGGTITYLNVNGNTGGTNSIAESWGPFLPGTIISGANGKWLKIANQVLLTAGQTYTVTQQSNNNTFVSMRASGVMWEFVSVPEPATMLLLGLGTLILRKRTR